MARPNNSRLLDDIHQGRRRIQDPTSEHLLGRKQVTLRQKDKDAGRNPRGQAQASARRVRFNDPTSGDEASTDVEEEHASDVQSVYEHGRPQVIYLSSELSEYLRPTDKLRAKVDSNLNMAISLDDPSFKIAHEIRGGWFGLVLFMFGWINGVVFMMAIVLFGAVVMSPAGESIGHLATGILE
ncbi:hypothetical protein BKA70DRAFT_1437412 [Coprinopsis sp. MPI-PUGE-AT-0042]|nr:hypothetical protein BKA70DRAFT_1442936 [Coprinopsis sp. MPI-PUGE-AT-0042]KAH6899604.1 hypothetical protein BKA70DRAFT_1437412 [Coprinopsis sp. MPI-PUGE-AT-0042]